MKFRRRKQAAVMILALLVAQIGLLQSAHAQYRRRDRDRSSSGSSATTAPWRDGNQTSGGENTSSAASAGASASVSPQTQQSYRERYSIVTERNIFLRDRPRADRNNNTGPSTAPVRTLEQTYVLTGVVLEGGEQRAYFEDRSRNSMVRVSVGDSLARGKIVDIDIDSVAYQGPAGKETWVDVGSDLTGTYSPSIDLSSASSDHPPSTSPADLGFDPNSPNLTIEQKMKLRRVQALQGGAPK